MSGIPNRKTEQEWHRPQKENEITYDEIKCVHALKFYISLKRALSRRSFSWAPYVTNEPKRSDAPPIASASLTPAAEEAATGSPAYTDAGSLCLHTILLEHARELAGAGTTVV